eukprot:sb/3461804/
MVASPDINPRFGPYFPTSIHPSSPPHTMWGVRHDNDWVGYIINLIYWFCTVGTFIYPASSNKPPVASSATGALSINSQLGGDLFPTGWQFIFNYYVTFKVCVNDQFIPKYRGNTNCNTYTLHWRVRNSTFRQVLSLFLPFCLTILIPLCYVWHAPYHAHYDGTFGMTRAGVTQCTDEDFLLLNEETEDFEEVAVIPEENSARNRINYDTFTMVPRSGVEATDDIDLSSEREFFGSDTEVLDDGMKDEGGIKIKSLRLQLEAPVISPTISEVDLGNRDQESTEDPHHYHPGDVINEHDDGRTDMGCQTEPTRRFSDIVLNSIVQTTYSGGKCLVDGCSNLLSRVNLGSGPGGISGTMKEDLVTMKNHLTSVISSYTKELSLERIRYKLFIDGEEEDRICRNTSQNTFSKFEATCRKHFTMSFLDKILEGDMDEKAVNDMQQSLQSDLFTATEPSYIPRPPPVSSFESSSSSGGVVVNTSTVSIVPRPSSATPMVAPTNIRPPGGPVPIRPNPAAPGSSIVTTLGGPIAAVRPSTVAQRPTLVQLAQPAMVPPQINFRNYEGGPCYDEEPSDQCHLFLHKGTLPRENPIQALHVIMSECIGLLTTGNLNKTRDGEEEDRICRNTSQNTFSKFEATCRKHFTMSFLDKILEGDMDEKAVNDMQQSLQSDLFTATEPSYIPRPPPVSSFESSSSSGGVVVNTSTVSIVPRPSSATPMVAPTNIRPPGGPVPIRPNPAAPGSSIVTTLGGPIAAVRPSTVAQRPTLVQLAQPAMVPPQTNQQVRAPVGVQMASVPIPSTGHHGQPTLTTLTGAKTEPGVQQGPTSYQLMAAPSNTVIKTEPAMFSRSADVNHAASHPNDWTETSRTRADTAYPRVYGLSPLHCKYGTHCSYHPPTGECPQYRASSGTVQRSSGPRRPSAPNHDISH